ncbi:MAG TPA: hypothetical protein QF753_21765 [Victivallales bacterium]|nr:hypothetical protein [Victivallales bacterium]
MKKMIGFIIALVSMAAVSSVCSAGMYIGDGNIASISKRTDGKEGFAVVYYKQRTATSINFALLDESGNVEAEKSISFTGLGDVGDLVITGAPGGGYAIIARIYYTSGGDQYYFVKLDKNGNTIDQKKLFDGEEVHHISISTDWKDSSYNIMEVTRESSYPYHYRFVKIDMNGDKIASAYLYDKNGSIFDQARGLVSTVVNVPNSNNFAILANTIHGNGFEFTKFVMDSKANKAIVATNENTPFIGDSQEYNQPITSLSDEGVYAVPYNKYKNSNNNIYYALFREDNKNNKLSLIGEHYVDHAGDTSEEFRGPIIAIASNDNRIGLVFSSNDGKIWFTQISKDQLINKINLNSTYKCNPI